MRFVMFLFFLVLSHPVLADEIRGSIALKQGQADNWLAEYCFEKPVTAFRFDRPMTGNMRQDYWTLEDTDYILEKVEEVYQVSRRDHADFKYFSLKLKTYTGLPEKDYYAFSEFSDSGVSVFTGYYMGSVKAASNPNWQDISLTPTYIARDGSKVYTVKHAVLGERFVYFGPQDAAKFPVGKIIVDPEVPAHVSDDILKSMRGLNETLISLFERKPKDDYLVFVAAKELKTRDGISIKGGAQPNQILFTFKGRDMQALMEDEPLWLPEFITHEVTHLWQKDIWPYLGEDQSWVHEGGADNLAHALMRLNGLFTAESYHKKIEQVEYGCSNLLTRSSVTRGAENRVYKIFYHCGNFVFNTVGAAINPKHPHEGVLSFWKTMAAWPDEARNTEKSVELVFETLTKLGVNEKKQSVIKEFLDTKPENPVAAIANFKSVLLND